MSERDDLIESLDRHRFFLRQTVRDLDDEPRRTAGPFERPREGSHECHIAGLLGGDIDADACAGAESVIDEIDGSHDLG